MDTTNSNDSGIVYSPYVPVFKSRSVTFPEKYTKYIPLSEYIRRQNMIDMTMYAASPIKVMNITTVVSPTHCVINASVV